MRLLPLMLLGCLSDLDPIETGDTGLATEATPTPQPPEVRCPQAIRDIGEGHTVREEPFTWTDNISVAVSPLFAFRLPEDTVSFALTGLANTGVLNVAEVEIDGVDLIEHVQVEPFADGLVQTSLPTNFETDLTADVPRGGHCLQIRLLAEPGLVGEAGQLNLLVRRGGDAGVIDLNLIFVGGSEAAINQGNADVAIDIVQQTWNRSGGPALGTVDTYTLDASAYATYQEAAQLAGSQVEPDDPTGVDVFFLSDLTNGEQGLLGFSGGIPGVLGFDGVPNSGVVILLDSHLNGQGTVSGQLMGATIAHEVGHMIGLHHASERDGSSLRKYDDVPTCGPSFDTNGDGLVDAFECQGRGAENFMFWTGSGGVHDISPEQAFVLSRSAAAE